jgi:DNA-binding MarR family transcriptional regulator
MSWKHDNRCACPPLFKQILLYLMSGKLQNEIKKLHPFDSLEQEAALNLRRTCEALAAFEAETFRATELSPTQYNVLRILRGAGEPLPCGEIASRMITREPDMTRLLDRLEKRGLLSRQRQHADRRVVLINITSKGLEMLSGLDDIVRDTHKRQLGHLGERRLKQLIELLEQARTPGEREAGAQTGSSKDPVGLEPRPPIHQQEKP